MVDDAMNGPTIDADDSAELKIGENVAAAVACIPTSSEDTVPTSMVCGAAAAPGTDITVEQTANRDVVAAFAPSVIVIVLLAASEVAVLARDGVKTQTGAVLVPVHVDGSVKRIWSELTKFEAVVIVKVKSWLVDDARNKPVTEPNDSADA